MFHHYQQVTQSVFESGINYYFGWFYFGRMVELFFIISGYVMHRYISSISEGKLSLKQWYFKRISRLLPLIAISVIVYEFGIHFHGLLCDGGICSSYAGKKVDIFGSLITMLGIQDGGAFPNPMVNNPMWYVSVLLITYVVFYIVTVLAKCWGCSPNYLYIAMVLLGCGIQTYGINLPFFNGSTSRGYYCFFFGLLLADYVKNHGVSKKLATGSVTAIITMLYFMLCQRSMVESNLHYLLSFVLFPALILLTETNTSKRIFNHRFWGKWGQISFNAFVWHEPMLCAMFTVTHIIEITPNYAQRKWMYLFCLLAEIVGVISYYLLEKPIDRYLQKALI